MALAIIHHLLAEGEADATITIQCEKHKTEVEQLVAADQFQSRHDEKGRHAQILDLQASIKLRQRPVDHVPLEGGRYLGQ